MDSDSDSDHETEISDEIEINSLDEDSVELDLENQDELEDNLDDNDIPDDDLDDVDEIKIEIKKIEKLEIKKITTPKYLFKFEYVRIIGMRAFEIRNQINVNPLESKRLAKIDLMNGKLNYLIRRPLADGTFEEWNLNELYFKKNKI